MELAIVKNLFKSISTNKKLKMVKQHNLTHAEINHPYCIKSIDTTEKEMKDFLFTLGCFEGEKVTVISELAGNYIVNVKDARYSIDVELAKVILI